MSALPPLDLARFRATVAETPASYHKPDQFGEMACACWCDRTIVFVPADDIRRGITRSCGRSTCSEAA